MFRAHCTSQRRLSRVADIGCSDGEVAIALASLFPRMSIVGIDSRTDELAIATERARTLDLANVHFVEDYFLQRSNHELYDVVTFSEVYEHLVAERQVLSLLVIGRMLRANGYLIMTCPNGEFFRSPLARHKTFDSRYPIGFFDDLTQTDHWLEPTKQELLRLLVSLGYDVVESGYFNLPVIHRTRWSARIAESVVEPLLNMWLLGFFGRHFCKNTYVVARKNPRSPLLSIDPLGR